MGSITEGILFGGFNSIERGMYLIERDAPSPDSYESIIEVPERHGVLDFSMISGERKFQNRTLTYEFRLFKTAYANRKTAEQEIKREIMPLGNQAIYDTHDTGYFWLGKARRVEVQDDERFKQLIVTIEFSVYPYLYHRKLWFDDVWDTFVFESDIGQYTAYQVDGELEIELINIGDTSVSPIIQVEVE